MVGWHHWLNGHGFGWTPGVGDGQGGLACCGSWGRKESQRSDWTELNWTEHSTKWMALSHHVESKISLPQKIQIIYYMISWFHLTIVFRDACLGDKAINKSKHDYFCWRRRRIVIAEGCEGSLVVVIDSFLTYLCNTNVCFAGTYWVTHFYSVNYSVHKFY